MSDIERITNSTCSPYIIVASQLDRQTNFGCIVKENSKMNKFKRLIAFK